jgi:hypothetical protein
LAISTFLALNAEAGWHTNAPYVAWPATNHLRWMTNVITATNATHWTNAAYAGWTNNYILTNLWKGTNIDLFGTNSVDLAPHFFIASEAGVTSRPAISGNYYLQAKDTRIHDCASALMERWLVLSTNNTSSNFYEVVDAAFPEDPWWWFGDGLNDWFYRSDVRSLRRCKILTLAILTNFYHYASVTNIAPLTEAQLCINAGVPTNFLSVAMYDDAASRELHRYAQGSATPYSRIVTCSWTLVASGTNIATNTTVDTYGNPVTLIGTNGQKFTAVITNKYLLSGTRAEQYGWDGMKAVITNLYITAVPNAWGIGSGTNSGAGGTSDTNSWATNYQGTIEPYLATINMATNDDPYTAIENTNGWTMSGYGYADPWNTLSAAWYWAMTNPVSIVSTGIAPYGVWYAQYRFYRYDSITYNNNDYNHATLEHGTNWTVTSIITNGLSWNHTNRWTDYKAPLTFTQTGPFSSETRTYAKSNGVQVLILTTNLAAGTFSITTQPVSVGVPALDAGFGADVSTIPGLRGDLGTPSKDEEWSWYAVLIHNVSTNVSDTFAASTNLTFPAYSNFKTFQFWNFEYK